MNIDRRAFLAGGAATAGALALNAAQLAPVLRRFHICAFEKPLQHLGYDELADFIARLGFDGIEATVRRGGHVLPEHVEEDLPRLVEALKKRRLEITIMTTDVERVSPLNEKVLRTGAKLGIKRYRLGAWKYDLKKPVLEQLDALRPQVKELAVLNRQVGITGLYQNHAGANRVGAGIWDLHHLLKDIDARELGVAFDIRHATVDGGSAWPVHFSLLRSRVGIVYAKDFEWRGRTASNVPLGRGNVDPAFFRQLPDSGYVGPISLHVEYPVDKPKLAEAFQRDLATLRGWLEGKAA
ncbi:MAG: sugar phosphate isomerase/epimerase family protein [Verrucomicrobiota bacterium]